MVESACGLVCLVLGWFLGSSFLSPPSVFSSLPSTMTWAPCPHGVRTRGKNSAVSILRARFKKAQAKPSFRPLFLQQRAPQGHSLNAQGAKVTSLRGAPLSSASPFSLSLPPLPDNRHASRTTDQLKGLCHKMGLFHGLLGRATTDSSGQGSDWLTINNAGFVLPLDMALLVTAWWVGRGLLTGSAALRSCADHADRLSL